MDERCEPVFVKNNELPAFEQREFTTTEICAAIEQLTDFNTIEGAQRIGNLWRIYPKKEETRNKIIEQGFVLRGIAISVYSRNPYSHHKKPSYPRDSGDRHNTEPETTRLIVSNVPISFSDDIILNAIRSLNVVITSKLIAEHDRDENGKMTHWKTGRRFVYIVVPDEPLTRSLQIGPFRAALYHKEQKSQQRQQESECKRCLEKGHKAANCLAPIKCKQCLKDGHKAGDPVCDMTPVPEDQLGAVGGVNLASATPVSTPSTTLLPTLTQPTLSLATPSTTQLPTLTQPTLSLATSQPLASSSITTTTTSLIASTTERVSRSRVKSSSMRRNNRAESGSLKRPHSDTSTQRTKLQKVTTEPTAVEEKTKDVTPENSTDSEEQPTDSLEGYAEALASDWNGE